MKAAATFDKHFIMTGELSPPLQMTVERIHHTAAATFPGASAPQLEAFTADIFRIVLEELSGGVHIPTPARLDRLARDYRIRRDYNGANTSELARREGITPRQVRRIVRK